jgi:hypothetical protein
LTLFTEIGGLSVSITMILTILSRYLNASGELRKTLILDISKC